jgi:hypothetical protein
MFCPLCKSEYREGYTRCIDCGAELVSVLPGGSEPAPAEAPEGTQDAVVLCREDDPSILTALMAALEEAHILFYSFPIHDPRTPLGPPFPTTPDFAQPYEIRVREQDLTAAQGILDQILEEDDVLELTETDAPDAERLVEQERQESSSDGSLEEETAEVWSGQEQSLADFISEALRENEIPCLVQPDSADDRAIRVKVRPSDVSKAKEIVREVVEGTPPR